MIAAVPRAPHGQGSRSAAVNQGWTDPGRPPDAAWTGDGRPPGIPDPGVSMRTPWPGPSNLSDSSRTPPTLRPAGVRYRGLGRVGQVECRSGSGTGELELWQRECGERQCWRGWFTSDGEWWVWDSVEASYGVQRRVGEDAVGVDRESGGSDRRSVRLSRRPGSGSVRRLRDRRLSSPFGAWGSVSRQPLSATTRQGGRRVGLSAFWRRPPFARALPPISATASPRTECRFRAG